MAAKHLVQVTVPPGARPGQRIAVRIGSSGFSSGGFSGSLSARPIAKPRSTNSLKRGIDGTAKHDAAIAFPSALNQEPMKFELNGDR